MANVLAAGLLAGVSLVALSATASAATLVGLTADGMLVRMDTESRRASAPVRVTGANGSLLGIDVRPKDGMLYGVTTAGQIVRIDAANGRATQVSMLNQRFESGGRAVVDFNPVADRLRLMGMSGQNFRVNVDTGEVATDGTLKYALDSSLSGTMPRITAGAYTNSMQGATATQLLTIDTILGQLNLQAPPNDGVQQMRGRIGNGLPASVAFDIAASGGASTGYLLAGNTLHTVNLETGAPTVLGPLANAPRTEIIDIAVLPGMTTAAAR
ncbi:DUF4394 domain-containing protein [Roseomonas sp. CCTCC AB2023176]|uniref:DUF4394 domain-containing protein n=1 Tax=Roseomonas sp. CCTCC AB2023176 TaxID=3342640 RepID=UPI0035D6AEFA